MVRDHDPKVANSQVRLTLLAIQNVLGEKNSREIYQSMNMNSYMASLPPDNLEQIFPAQDYAGLLETIETTYGSRGPRILKRIGREYFHLTLREQPNWMSSARRVMNLWKPVQRIEFVLEAIVETQQKTYSHSEVWLEDKNGQLSYIEQNCLVCYQRLSSTPVCIFKIGFISEAIHWATDADIKVEETACIAAGDSYCRFSIEKTLPPRKSTS